MIAWSSVPAPAARSSSGLERLAPGRRRTELEEKAGNLFAILPCEPVNATAADRYANVKASQQRRGLPLDENDLLVAATAIVLDANLVSLDADFRAIGGWPGLNPSGIFAKPVTFSSSRHLGCTTAAAQVWPRMNTDEHG